MKKKLVFIAISYCKQQFIAIGAGDKTNIPKPEFSKEVYYLKKDSVNSVVRLEKGSSKMENKTKMGWFGWL